MATAASQSSKKQVAATLKNLVLSDEMKNICDLSKPVDELTETILEHWTYDIDGRKPGPAVLENGQLKPTDLDLLSFMGTLASRRAVITLPVYEGMRPRTKREGEVVTSEANRHGKIMGLTANKETFSFSVRIIDQNVIQYATAPGQEDQTGAFRNFALVGIDGEWHDGWKEIQFRPDAKENDFIQKFQLAIGGRIPFQHFVHPNRWGSVYGQYYLLTKCLIARLEDDADWLRDEIKRLLALGVKYPSTGEGSKREWPKSKTEEGQSVKVKAFEAEVDMPDFFGKRVDAVPTTEELVRITDRERDIRYTILPQLRFAVRGSELAFFKAGCKDKGFPSWIRGAKWEVDYQKPGKTGKVAANAKKWFRLVLSQPYPFMKGFALRYRVFEKSETVAK